jgi:hypothetical protein
MLVKTVPVTEISSRTLIPGQLLVTVVQNGHHELIQPDIPGLLSPVPEETAHYVGGLLGLRGIPTIIRHLQPHIWLVERSLKD